jgi:proton-translocating NADH-quinone oxidoreductase chain L
MLILILLFPFFGFVSGSLFGFLLGTGVCITTCTGIFLSFLLSSYLFLDILTGGSVYILTLDKWIYSEFLQVDWCFCFDSLSSVMLVIVTFISFLVHFYSTEYMEHDPHLPRFMSYLSLFTFFMLVLVTANNFLQMFVGWEGVGVSSYLLINFWFTRIQANKSAIKAMLINRVGDFALLLALFTICFTFNSLNYDVVFTLAPYAFSYNLVLGGFEIPVLDFICIFLFLGAMGKSAQIGLHTWLPDAMEGPTPVSALIHAATMVTAGVFLLARCSYFFELSPISLNLVVFIGSLTSIFAATTGLFQNDIKKVIAYSTCSQLGYMIFACGLSSYDVGIFHLSNHAFFKALLFLGAGSVIHACSDEQDMRKFGGLKNLLPFSYAVMLIGSLALIGFPFLSGFYSKDVILELSYSKYTFSGHFSYILGSLAAFCTAFYSARVLYFIFLSKPNGNKIVVLGAHEGSFRMGFPLFLLSFFSIFIGYISKEIFIGFGTSFWGSSIFIIPSNYGLLNIEFLSLTYKILPLILTFIGLFSAYFLFAYNIFYYFSIKITPLFKTFYTFFIKKWYFDRFYNEFLTQKVLSFSYFYSYKTIDRGLVEVVGPFGIVYFINLLYVNVNKFQTGFILNYLVYICIFIVCFIFLSFEQNILVFLCFIFYSFYVKRKNIM